MKKHYYTDGLKAAWMCKHFKMNFTCNHPSLLNKFYSPVTLTAYGTKKPSKSEVIQKFYIAADCYGMLEQQEGDLINRMTGEIIQRNGKAFFMPEVENVNM